MNLFTEPHISPLGAQSLPTIEDLNETDDSQEDIILYENDGTTKHPDPELYGDTDTGFAVNAPTPNTGTIQRPIAV